MRLGQSFSMAIKSIKNNKGRSFLTMLGIIIGLAAVITLVTLVSCVKKQFMMSFETMGTNVVQVEYYQDQRDVSKEIYSKTLELSDLVQAYTPNLSTYETVKQKDRSVNSCRILLGSEDYDVCSNYTIERGSMFTHSNVLNSDRVAVIGSKVRTDLFDFENPIGKTIRIKGERFTVVGLFEEKTGAGDYMNNVIVVPYNNNRFLMNSPAVSSFIIKAVDGDATNQVVTEMQEYMKELTGNDWGFWVYSENQYMDFYDEQLAMMSLVGGGIAGISLIVGGIGIMNIMLVSVTERTREIGIRKALGAKERTILAQFVVEAATTSALGGALGIALGYAVSMAANKVLPMFMSDTAITVSPSFNSIVVAFGISVGIGVLFGYLPARRAARLNPIEALRYD